MARAQLTAAQVVDLTQPVTKAQADIKTQPMLGGLIEVRATRPPFVDQVEAVTIGGKFQPVKWHPWLQAQIDAGLLVQK